MLKYRCKKQIGIGCILKHVRNHDLFLFWKQLMFFTYVCFWMQPQNNNLQLAGSESTEEWTKL